MTTELDLSFMDPFTGGQVNASGMFGGNSTLGPTHRGNLRKMWEDQSFHDAAHTPAKIKRDITATRDAWQEAGMHPLWAMGGGSGAFGSAVNIGGALDTAPATGGAVISNKRLRPQEAAQTDLTRARIGLLEAQTDEVRSRINNSKAATTPIPQDQKPLAESKHSGYIVPGGGILKTGRSADAQEWEDRYWEIGGMIGALLNIGGDSVGLLPDSFWDKWIDTSLKKTIKKYFKADEMKKAQERHPTNYDYLNQSP